MSARVEAFEGIKHGAAWQQTSCLSIGIMMAMAVCSQLFVVSSVAVGPHAPSILGGYRRVARPTEGGATASEGNATAASADVASVEHCQSLRYQVDRDRLWIPAVLIGGLLLMILIDALMIMIDGEELQVDAAIAKKMTVYQKMTEKRRRRMDRLREAWRRRDVFAAFAPANEGDWQALKAQRLLSRRLNHKRDDMMSASFLQKARAALEGGGSGEWKRSGLEGGGTGEWKRSGPAKLPPLILPRPTDDAGGEGLEGGGGGAEGTLGRFQGPPLALSRRPLAMDTGGKVAESTGAFTAWT